jgi:hypothetical protein
MISSRIYLNRDRFDLSFFRRNKFPWWHPKEWHATRYFPWILVFTCVAAFIFGVVAFAFILLDVHNKLSRGFVAVTVLLVHGFLGISSLYRLQNKLLPHLSKYIVLYSMLFCNLVALLPFGLVCLCSNIATILLVCVTIGFHGKLLTFPGRNLYLFCL